MKRTGGPLSNAAHNLAKLAHSPVSWVFAVAVLLIHALVMTGGGVDALSSGYENLGLSREGFLSGKIWQLASYGFLHGGWLHAAVNALFVLLVGSRVEDMAGGAAMARTVFAGILGGGVAHLLLGSGLLVGLSGGCLALLLMLTTLSPQSRMFPLPVTGRNLGMGILVGEGFMALVNPALGFPGLSRIGDWITAQGMGGWFDIGHACHFGGGLAGWLAARWILRPRISLKRLQQDRARREARM
jgi:membrane associated rhomboid family serine protease